MKVTSLILGLLVSYVSSKGCDLPPSEWCSTPETAELCQVTKECKWLLSQYAAAPKVKLSLYYESMCPFSIGFITGELAKAYAKVWSIMEVELIPFGNAHITTVNGETSFTCQHGPLECQANLVETCATKLLSEKDALSFVYCVSKDIQHGNFPFFAYKRCAKSMNLDMNVLFGCANGEQGMNFEKAMQEKTNSLKPRKTGVPWIVINGVHTEALQHQAQTDLTALVCKLYKGSTKPAACT